MTSLLLRAARREDDDAIWHVIEPTFRAGETYPIPSDILREQALAFWCSPGHSVFVAQQDESIVGMYYLRANNLGGGAHVANCGYIVSPTAIGRGVARAMCAHSLEAARAAGFRAMQFNFVVSTNDRAVLLWQSMGFEIVGRLPEAFKHPRLGHVDALVMYRKL